MFRYGSNKAALTRSRSTSDYNTGWPAERRRVGRSARRPGSCVREANRDMPMLMDIRALAALSRVGTQSAKRSPLGVQLDHKAFQTSLSAVVMFVSRRRYCSWFREQVPPVPKELPRTSYWNGVPKPRKSK